MKKPDHGRGPALNIYQINYDDRNLASPLHPCKLSLTKDARVLHFLQSELERTGTGSATLQQVFCGLLSILNRHIIDFANALAKEAD